MDPSRFPVTSHAHLEHHSAVALLLTGRALRALVEGYIGILIPLQLLALGHGPAQIGLLSTSMLLGSALAVLALGLWGHRLAEARLFTIAALLMAFTGFCFPLAGELWPLLLLGFLGSMNPGGSDLSLFQPLEQARLAGAGPGQTTGVFARYSLIGSVFAALGALAAGLPDWLAVHTSLAADQGRHALFFAYGAAGLLLGMLYLRLPAPERGGPHPPACPLQASRPLVAKLAALFALDAFAGGLLTHALMATWLIRQYGLSAETLGLYFFATGLLAAVSQVLAPALARRFGLLNTMVFTHIPASLCLILAALTPSFAWAMGLLLLRALFSQMDVPTRTAFVMENVLPEERRAAASFTSLTRSLAAALGPALAGYLLSTDWPALPLVACGVLKIVYDLSLWVCFRAKGKGAGRRP